MSNKRKAGGFRRKKSGAPTSRPGFGHGHGAGHLDCGCTGMVVRAADGVCEECGVTDSMTFPPMPSSQGVGEVTDVAWSCTSCDSGEVVGRAVVTKVVG